MALVVSVLDWHSASLLIEIKFIESILDVRRLKMIFTEGFHRFARHLVTILYLSFLISPDTLWSEGCQSTGMHIRV